MHIIIIRALLAALILSLSVAVLALIFNLIFHHNPIAKRILNRNIKIPLLKSFCVSSLLLSSLLVPFYMMYAPNRIVNVYASPALLPGDIVISKRSSINSIKRGQLIVYKDKDRHIELVSRVIAVGGDEIRAEDGKIWINGKLLKQSYSSKIIRNGESFHIFYENNTDNKYKIIKHKDSNRNFDLRSLTLADEEIFCLLDSRYGDGFFFRGDVVNDFQVIGTVKRVIASWDHEAKEFRKNRFFVEPDQVA